MATNTNALLSEFLQFMQDLPFASIGTAVASGGTNVMIDVEAGEAIVAAALKDFFSGASATTSAPATTAAVATAAANATPAAGS